MKWLAMIFGAIAVPYVLLTLGVILGAEWRRRAQARREERQQHPTGELADDVLDGETVETLPTYCPECAKARVLAGHVGMPPHGAPVLCGTHSRVALSAETLIRRVPVQARRDASLAAQQDAYDVWQRETAAVYRTPLGLELEREWFWVDEVDPIWN